MSTEYRPSVDRVSTECRPSVDRVSTDCRPLYRPLASTDISVDITHSKRDNKIPSDKKKCLIGLQDSYQDRLVLFDVHLYDKFHVPDVLIVLLYM